MKRIVTFGEILLRLSAPGVNRFSQCSTFDASFGGSEANVAASLSRFGNDSAHVSVVPDNDLGQSVIQALKGQGINTNFVIKGKERLGIYFLEKGTMHRSSKIIYDRFDSAFSNINKENINWRNILKSADWFHWSGITPAVSFAAADTLLDGLRIAKEMGVMVSGDINYRRNLWQYGKSPKDVMPALISLTDFVVADTTDMENCAEISGSSFETAAINFAKKFNNVKKIATTNRVTVSASHNHLMALLWNGNLLKSKTYDLTHIEDRIGSGDAFMAGLIHASLQSRDDQYVLDFSTAACALKHSITGDVNLSTADEVKMLMQEQNIGKLLR